MKHYLLHVMWLVQDHATLSSAQDVAGAGLCNTVFCTGCSWCRTVTLVHSRQLWLPAQDLSKMGPVGILPWMTEGPLSGKLLEVNGYWGERKPFPSVV